MSEFEFCTLTGYGPCCALIKGTPDTTCFTTLHATCKAYLFCPHLYAHKNVVECQSTYFSETEKFNGTNFATFETLIIVAASSQGVLGCLQGTIPNPASPQNSTDLHYTPVVLNIPLPDNPTPWYSTTPSGTEWAVCNAWAHALLLYNTKNAFGLGLKLDGTAAEAWTSLIKVFVMLYIFLPDLVIPVDSKAIPNTFHSSTDSGRIPRIPAGIQEFRGIPGIPEDSGRIHRNPTGIDIKSPSILRFYFRHLLE